MTEKELKHLSRRDLLEILLDQTKKMDELQAKLKLTEEKLEEKEIKIANSSSLAEAALKMNNIFEDADRAAEQYLSNIKNSESESAKVLEDAKKQAEEIIEQARKVRDEKLSEVNQYLNNIKSVISSFALEYPEL